MSAYELQDHEIALSLALVVSGLTVRYVSHDGWPAASGLTDYKAIIGATPMGGTLGILGGSADYQNVTVSLATLGASADSDLDPGIQLGRVDYRDCGAYARLITTLVEETGTLEVHVDRDPTPFGMGAGGFIHIARECIQVTGTAGTGTIIDPWRFTLGARGARDTLPQQHYVHDVTPMRPWVTSEPFAWRWRRAWLYARARRPGGTFGDLVTVMPCFVGEAPVIDTGEVSVELLPLTAILDKKLAGAGNAVRLLQGYHYFADGIGSTVEHAQRVLSGTIYDDRVTAPDAIASAKLTAPTAPYDRAADVTLPSGHPRHTRLDVGVDLAAEPQNPHVGAGQFQLSAGLPTFATVAGTRAASTEAIELHRVDMITPPEPGTAGLLRWPSEALDLINAAWVPGTHTGATGAWADVKVGDDPDRGPHIQIRFNVEQRNGPVFLIFWSGDWVPGDQGDPPFDWSTGAPVGHADRRRRLFYGLDFRAPTDTEDLAYRGVLYWERAIDAGRDSALREQYWPIRGWPTAYYQSGERYILVDSDVPVPAGGTTTLAISYTERGERRTTACRIISTTALATGYALEVHPDDREEMPCFGDWGDGEPVEITPSVRFAHSSDAVVLLQMLHSNGGGLVSDPVFDLQAFGGGLATADVDRPSFTRHATPPGLDRWSPWVQPGTTLRDVVDPILLSTSSALVMSRTIGGEARLARVSMGLESAAGVTAALSVWETAQPPANAPDNVVTNVYKLRLNHGDNSLGDAQAELIYTDAASVAAFGDGEVLELELRGLYTDPRDPAEGQALVRDLVARASTVAGYPRVRWVGRVPLGDVWTLDLGSEVLVTSPHLRGRGTAWGVTGLVGRIVHIRIPLWSTEATAEVGIVHYGVRSTRINAALEVTAAPALDEVTVAANSFANLQHPLTGGVLRDLDGWSVGDDVVVRPRYDQDNTTALTITAINRTTRAVTLSGAHGLVGPDWGYLEPPSYPSASMAVPPSGAAQHDLAHLSDADGRLNGGTEEGQDLV